MTFRLLLKIVKKGAYFYLFILCANIERRRKQDSYCKLYMYFTNIHRWLKYKSCLQSRTTLPNIKTNEKYDFLWHKQLKTENCVISDVTLLE